MQWTPVHCNPLIYGFLILYRSTSFYESEYFLLKRGNLLSTFDIHLRVKSELASVFLFHFQNKPYRLNVYNDWSLSFTIMYHRV